jgi:acyl-CoA synthetase (AMP-forming)/AMP-acid ligase II
MRHGDPESRLTVSVQGYGMTETNAYVCSVAGGDYLERVSLCPVLTEPRLTFQPDSTGPPVPISDIRIVDPETKRLLQTGQSGLLQVRGPQVMKCYYHDEGEPIRSDPRSHFG